MPPEIKYMRMALRLAARGYGATSPNPMVGAVIVRKGKVLGRGWHRRAGGPHAEMEALSDAASRGCDVRGATLCVTLEPCSTHGRTPPCTDAIVGSGLKRVVVGATDPNPKHAGRGLHLLRRAGIAVVSGILEPACTELNQAFNHWIVHRTPLVTLKAAMSLDGRIATASGESKWITGEKARAFGMRLRRGSDAILVGINTILLDNPSLTLRPPNPSAPLGASTLRRIVLDSRARIPLDSRVVCDVSAPLTTIVVGPRAPRARVAKLSRRVRVLLSPDSQGSPGQIDLPWLLRTLGKENVTSLLVEGGGQTNASFLAARLAHRVFFFYAPKIIGGRSSRPAVAGQGAASLFEAIQLKSVRWRRMDDDLMLSARLV